MTDENTKLKDLTEMEKIVIGLSVNFVYNLIGNQIFHIENHDPKLQELLINNEAAQEEFILIKNCEEIAISLIEIMATTLSSLPKEEVSSLAKPAMKLEKFLEEVYEIIVYNNN
jgi:hypothetical protein